jgi:predicted transcriptional regulator
MGVLSLKQPFAELILEGEKTIELRKWNTKFRGKFLIHASKSPDIQAMKQFGFNSLPCGFIIGMVELIEVKRYRDEKEHSLDKDKHLANSAWGSYGFVLKNPQRLKKLISINGKLGFWDYNGLLE